MEERERKSTVRGTEDENAENEDVELHKKRNPAASEDAPSTEGGAGDDDVELHRRVKAQ